MPVSFSPAPHKKIEPIHDIPPPLTTASAASILQFLRPQDSVPIDELLQPSLLPPNAFKIGARPPSPAVTDAGVATANAFKPQKNGLVHTIMDAYDKHHALVLRPDDIWLSILTQFSFFVNGRAEELRSKFVSHEDKKTLVVMMPHGTRHTVDFGPLAGTMTFLMKKNLVDPTLREWVIPAFSTTTHNDTVAASVVMMATLRAYFEYVFGFGCGLPRVTLLGGRSDWEDILSRIERLKEYGPETKAWSRMLQPVLRRFVLAFEPGYADSEENREFWGRVAHRVSGVSGFSSLSGWITAFCVFDDKGKWIGGKLDSCDMEPIPSSVLSPKPIKGVVDTLILDGVSYHSLGTASIPYGHAEVPVKLNDNGVEYDGAMLAGLVGTAVSDSGVNAGMKDQLSPVVGWWMYTLQKQAKE